MLAARSTSSTGLSRDDDDDAMKTTSEALRRLSGSLRGLSESAGTATNAIALNSGDPGFDTPRYIVDAASAAMRAGFTHYADPAGDHELRAAIAAYQSRMSCVDLLPEEILVTHGGTGALTASLIAFLDAGDEVILMDPTYSLYADLLRVIGAGDKTVAVTPLLKLDPDAIRRSITPRTRMLLVNFPSNPTGAVLDRVTLDALAVIANEHDLLVISDEVYDQIVFEGQHLSVLSHPDLTDRTLVVNSFSKTYAMTGWRVGWVAARRPLLEAVTRMAARIGGPVSTVAMRAALAALTCTDEDRAWRASMLKEYRRRRTLILEGLSNVRGIEFASPAAAFYVWVRYESDLDPVALVRFLTTRGLRVRPGTEYGQAGGSHLRFTFAPPLPVIERGISIFRSCMEELQATRGARP